jgi:hypothetical protein
MAAQGYQESTLDQDVKSPVGAIGVMQVMPETGKEQKVGDIRQLEPNVHAGAPEEEEVRDAAREAAGAHERAGDGQDLVHVLDQPRLLLRIARAAAARLEQRLLARQRQPGDQRDGEGDGEHAQREQHVSRATERSAHR